MKKIAILLSGSGVFDGSEIHESVLTILSISQSGAQYQCFAPDIPQAHVVNHLTGEVEASETRNVLVESARIARGEVLATDKLDISKFDALVIPGGFGAAKNLCNFAFNGKECEINPVVKTFIQAFVDENKPIGFICISPVMIPLFYGEGATGTIGTDLDTASAFNAMGGNHTSANVHEIVVDEQRKIVSTPAYMLAENITQAKVGIEKLVSKVIELI